MLFVIRYSLLIEVALGIERFVWALFVAFRNKKASSKSPPAFSAGTP